MPAVSVVATVWVFGVIVASIAMTATPEEIEEECKAEIEIYGKGGGFILATGCEYGPNAPLRNAKRIVEAAKKYGVYK